MSAAGRSRLASGTRRSVSSGAPGTSGDVPEPDGHPAAPDEVLAEVVGPAVAVGAAVVRGFSEPQAASGTAQSTRTASSRRIDVCGHYGLRRLPWGDRS